MLNRCPRCKKLTNVFEQLENKTTTVEEGRVKIEQSTFDYCCSCNCQFNTVDIIKHNAQHSKAPANLVTKFIVYSIAAVLIVTLLMVIKSAPSATFNFSISNAESSVVESN